MIDPEMLDERENFRIASQNKSREQRLAIKKNVQTEMSDRANSRAKNLSEIYNSISLNIDDLED